MVWPMASAAVAAGDGALSRRLPFGRAILVLVQADLGSHHDNDLTVDVIVCVRSHNPRTLPRIDVTRNAYSRRSIADWRGFSSGTRRADGQSHGRRATFAKGRWYVRQKIVQGLADVRAGRVAPQEEVEKRFARARPLAPDSPHLR